MLPRDAIQMVHSERDVGPVFTALAAPATEDSDEHAVSPLGFDEGLLSFMAGTQGSSTLMVTAWTFRTASTSSCFSWPIAINWATFASLYSHVMSSLATSLSFNLG